MLQRLKKWAKRLKHELHVLQLAMAEPAVPWYAKALILLTLAYALSPIDLIPDFIPVLGLLDDLILLPGFIYLAIRLIPRNALQKCRKRAELETFAPHKSWLGGTFVLLLWGLLLYWAWTRYHAYLLS